MTALAVAAREVLSWLAAHGWDACVIGGLAVQRWGESRLTNDVDVAVIVSVGSEARFIDEALTAFRPRRPDARAFALLHRVLLVSAANGVPLDVALGASGFEADSVARATAWELEPGCVVRTCSAEDLILYKLIAGRPRDESDIEGIVTRQGSGLDAAAIRRSAEAFGEVMDGADLAAPFERAISRIGRRA